MISMSERHWALDLLLCAVLAAIGAFLAFWLVPGPIPQGGWPWAVLGALSVASERIFARLLGLPGFIGFGLGIFLAIVAAKLVARLVADVGGTSR